MSARAAGLTSSFSFPSRSVSACWAAISGSGATTARSRPDQGGPAISILVIDVGTSGVRASIVRPDGAVEHTCYQAAPPSPPSPGFVEFDPAALARAALTVARQSLAAGGPVEAVGITNQRSSTV